MTSTSTLTNSPTAKEDEREEALIQLLSYHSLYCLAPIYLLSLDLDLLLSPLSDPLSLPLSPPPPRSLSLSLLLPLLSGAFPLSPGPYILLPLSVQRSREGRQKQWCVRIRNGKTKIIGDRERYSLPGYQNEDEMRFKIDQHTIKEMTTARNN